MKNLYLVRGVPGSGKTTFAERIAPVVLSADMYFEDDEGNYNFDGLKIKHAHAWCQSEAEQFMKSGIAIAVANTFTQEWEMQAYFDLAEKYGYTVFSVVVENRHGGVNTHGVPEEKVKQMCKRFEVKL